MDFDPEAYLQAADAARLLSPASGPVEHIPTLTFYWGSDRYGLPLATVREVIALRQLTPIPGLPQHMIGATNHRGEVMAVIDARPILDLPRGLVQPGSFLVVIDVGGESAGILVDALGDITDIPTIDQGDLSAPGFVAQVNLPDNATLLYLHADRLVDFLLSDLEQ